MSLPWDDPNADPLADIRRWKAGAQPTPPGQPVLVPRRLKEILAGQAPDGALVAHPEPTVVEAYEAAVQRRNRHRGVTGMGDAALAEDFVVDALNGLLQRQAAVFAAHSDYDPAWASS